MLLKKTPNSNEVIHSEPGNSANKLSHSTQIEMSILEYFASKSYDEWLN